MSREVYKTLDQSNKDRVFVFFNAPLPLGNFEQTCWKLIDLDLDWLVTMVQSGGIWWISNHMTIGITWNDWDEVCFLELNMKIHVFSLVTWWESKSQGNGSKWSKLHEPLLLPLEISLMIFAWIFKITGNQIGVASNFELGQFQC